MKNPVLFQPKNTPIPTYEDVLRAVANVRDRAQRECDHKLRQRDFEHAVLALAERDACEQIERELSWLYERKRSCR